MAQEHPGPHRTEGIEREWLDNISRVLENYESIKTAWVFGSRARGDHKPDSDLDIAVRLKPEDGEDIADWCENAKQWKTQLNSILGGYPKIDLQLASPDYDEYVWPGVQQDGIVFYERHP